MRIPIVAFISAVCVLGLACVTSGQSSNGISFTQPVTSPTFDTNSTVLIMWELDGKASNPNANGQLELALSPDGSTNVVVIKIIDTALPISAKQKSWVVPSDLKSSKYYSFIIRVGGVPAYTPPFGINNPSSPANVASVAGTSASPGAATATGATAGSKSGATSISVGGTALLFALVPGLIFVYVNRQ